MSGFTTSSTVKCKRSIAFERAPVKRRRQYDPASLQLAVDAMNNGMSAYRAARVFGVPETTLKDRRLGNVRTGCTPGPQTTLTKAEERQLVDHIRYMANIGYGYSKSKVQYLCADYAVACGKKSANSKPMSNCWFYGFLKRWPDLSVSKPQKLSLVRAKSASRETLDSYFAELQKILTENDLLDKPERIFNIDETGINTEHSPPYVVCDSSQHTQAVTSPRSGTVTIIGGGNAIGNHIPPYYVFPGKRWNNEFLDGAPTGSAGSMSDSGWSNSSIFSDYLTKHFVKHANVSSGPDSPKTLILFDGHRSHIQLTLIDWARDHNIILFVLPPHTSHITQPLDVSVFGPLKSMYYRECQLYMQKHPGQRITKYDIAKLTAKPYIKSLSPENLISGFRKTGVFPFSQSTIEDKQLAPSTIYPSSGRIMCADEQNNNAETDDKENSAPTTNTPQNSSSKKFFQSRTITSVVNVKRRKKFVPPFLAGSLAEKKHLLPNKKIEDKVRTATYVPSPISPKPGPSKVQIESSQSDSESSDSGCSESSNCCVCNKFSPPALKKCIDLVIVKWAQCDKCSHWTHLSFCTPTRVVRRHSVFFCPHCE